MLSPYFNQSRKLADFYNLLYKYSPDFDSPKLQKEKVYRVLYKDRPYNDNNMRELMSDTFKMVNTFLAHDEFSKQELTQSEVKYDWMLKQELYNLAHAEVYATDKILGDNIIHEDYYYYRWQNSLRVMELEAVRYRGEEYKMFGELDLMAHINDLNIYYLFNSLKSHIYLLSLSRIYKVSLDDSPLIHLENLALHYIDKGNAAIDLLFSIYLLARRQDDESFFGLKERMFKNESSIPNHLKGEASVVLENYCSKRFRDGEERFAKEAFEVYRFVVENDLHFESGGVSSVFYCNVALRGSELGEFEWVRNFIESTKNYLPEDQREYSYLYSTAHLLFAEKKFKEALRTALLCNIPLFVMKILIRILIARCQYELGMMDEFENELNTLRHHLNDEKLTDDRRAHWQTFITASRRLMAVTGLPDYAKMQDLVGFIENAKSMPNRKWFFEKIENLKVKRRK